MSGVLKTIGLICALLAIAVDGAFAQQTGTLSPASSATARAACCPASRSRVSERPSLIGGARTAVTGEAGSYQFAPAARHLRQSPSSSPASRR